MSLIRDIIRNDRSLSETEYFSLFSSLIENKENKCSLTALLAALSAKPVELNDVLHFVKYVEQDAPKRRLSVSDQVVNIVGTGGGISTFNISTTATFVAAAAGATVLKSGSYSYNSRCGSLDLLSQLGINLNLKETELQSMLEELRIGFVSPKSYPPMLRRIAVSIMPLTLREIGGFLNTVGPLLCPYQVKGQICGVRSLELIDVFSQALEQLEINNSITVWAEIGMDEFSAIGLNHFVDSRQGNIKQVFNPKDYQLIHHNPDDLAGGSPEENIAIMQSLLKHGKATAGRDTVAINAAYIILLSGLTDSIQEAITLAIEAIQSGKAYQRLQEVIEFGRSQA